MRRFIIALLCCILLAGCSKTGNTSLSENKAQTTATPVTVTSPTVTSGTGQPAGSAIDDIVGTANKTEAPLPTPAGLVNDYAKVVDAKTKAKLEATLARLKETSNIEFVVAVVDTTGETSGADYALSLARGWRVGLKDGSEGGIILLVAIKDRRWHIHWTRRLEDVLPDSTGQELGRQMTEPFRQGKYGEGIFKGVEAVISRLHGRRASSAHN